MAQATLSFNLDDPEDRMAHLRAVQSTELVNTLWTIAHSKKSFLNKVEFTTYPTQYELIEDIYEFIWESMNSRGINLDNLTH